MSVIDRAKRVYVSAKVPPEGVYRATRYERIRRNVWMIGSTFFAFNAGLVTLAVVLGVLSRLGMPEPSGATGGFLVLAIWLVISAIIDLRLFAWGIDYFRIVPPWQFRVGDDAR